MTSKWEAPQTWHTGHGRGVEAVCVEDAPLRGETRTPPKHPLLCHRFQSSKKNKKGTSFGWLRVNFSCKLKQPCSFRNYLT